MRLIHAIHHVSLIVADTERALGFYRDLLGLEVDPERPELGYPGAWLRIGAQQIHLLELPNPDPIERRPPHGGRDRHLAVVVTHLDAVARLLEGAGIGYSLSRSGRRALFTRDPDANALEVIEQPDPETDAPSSGAAAR
ncbi:MAG: VOC family protein [Lamprobacter sp.]|uniref:VOC family protein n=1 Tax=Lamprobacter sp. TaxID=3100796 RepID=UPI002B258880|nr:VOC family protein [Lamprobacter sp.]MEA3639425.1 VOC family protein [Lamprobacter sp.]